MGRPGGVTGGGKWGGSGAAEPGRPLSWTPGSASAPRARPASGCAGAARGSGGRAGAGGPSRGEVGSHCGVSKGQLGLRGPARTAGR